MAVFKAQVTLTLFGQYPGVDAFRHYLTNASLEEIAMAMENDDLASAVSLGELVAVSPAQLEAELQAIGYDASFFTGKADKEKDEDGAKL